MCTKLEIYVLVDKILLQGDIIAIWSVKDRFRLKMEIKEMKEK